VLIDMLMNWLVPKSTVGFLKTVIVIVVLVVVFIELTD
jgi:hypothetical protein